MIKGDEERKMGFDITYLCDRHSTNVAKGQIGFIQFIVKPLFDVAAQFLPEIKKYLQSLSGSVDYWSSVKNEYETKSHEIKEN